MTTVGEFSLNYWFDGYLDHPELYPADETVEQDVNGKSIRFLLKRCPETNTVLDAKWAVVNEADKGAAMEDAFVAECHQLALAYLA